MDIPNIPIKQEQSLLGNYYKEGEDNTNPWDDTNLLKKLPLFGCDNSTKLLIGVRIQTYNQEDRMMVRNTWGNESFGSATMKMVFLLGQDEVFV